jgi:hypothetical protein
LVVNRSSITPGYLLITLSVGDYTTHSIKKLHYSCFACGSKKVDASFVPAAKPPERTNINRVSALLEPVLNAVEGANPALSPGDCASRVIQTKKRI